MIIYPIRILSQTEADLILKCDECDFEAKNERALGWHIGRSHGWPKPSEEKMEISIEDDGQKHLYCNFCNHSFRNKIELMEHKKFTHTDKVSKCWNFPNGKCTYTDDKCWFQHSENAGEIFCCKFCDKEFSNQSTLLIHRKRYHANTVPLCRSYLSGSCVYTNETCWFKHAGNVSENNKNTNYENKNRGNKDKEVEKDTMDEEVIQKLFKMMENFTNEMRQLKEKNELL